ADLGCPVSHQQVRQLASKIAVRNGFPEGVGKNWLQGFLSRNTDIRTLKGLFYAADDAGDTNNQAEEQILL
ncbi:transposase, partial [Fusarium langsethiae]